MLSSEEMLTQAALDGTVDLAEWPRVLENLLQKLHNIVHNDFPQPRLPLPPPLASTIDPEVVASTPPTLPSDSDPRSQEPTLSDATEQDPVVNSQSSTKENDAPAVAAPTSRPDSRLGLGHTRSDTQPADIVVMPRGTLPPEMLSVYTNATRILERDFAQAPPYTVQRLAELVVYPKRHYRFLPSYLRALDRIVSVTSRSTEFPMQIHRVNHNGSFLSNGEFSQANGVLEREGFGSDESLGGALLTPIPWLRNQSQSFSQSTSQSEGELHSESTETIEGPNGPGGIETVSVTVNGVPSTSNAAHLTNQPVSPTLSEQSDASSGSSTASTEAQLREQGAVTQGELLRQEQEADVVPIAQIQARRPTLSSNAAAVGRDPLGHPLPDVITDAEEQPHARGPEYIGMEDMGPQRGSHTPGHIDVEAAVGRQKSPQPPNVASPPSAPQADFAMEMAQQDDAGQPGQDPKDVEKQVDRLKQAMDKEKEEDVKDSEGDVILADADGVDVKEKEKMDPSGSPGSVGMV